MLTATILRQLRVLGLIAAASCAIVLSACQMCHFSKKCGGEDECATHTKVCATPTVRALAHDLDALEAHIERYGSVTIQHPSVWGQARLTKHREEFERMMAKDLCTFNLTLQGSVSRSDQAYFANSFALGMAVSGPQAFVTPSAVTSSASASAAPPISIPTPDPISPVYLDRNPARLPSALGFGTIGKDAITVEPSVYLNQKARYLNHLHELRRINEGDDTGDSPGYALNLIRVPVSVLPGKHTQEGHGAEVTMTLKPHLSEELLPTTFRNLVVNDLLEQIGVPLTQFLNDKEQVAHFKTVWTVFDLEYEIWKNMKKVRNLKYSDLSPDSKKVLAKSILFQEGEPAAAWNKGRQILKESALIVPATKLRHAKRPFPPSQMVEIFGEDEIDTVIVTAQKLFKRDPANKYWLHYPDVQGYLQEELAGAYRFLADPNNIGLWEHCSQELVTAIHTRSKEKGDVEQVKKIRDRFGDQVLATTKRVMEDDVTVSLAWAILVESALLNDQLVKDMKEAAAAKSFPMPTNEWQPYYLPNPPAEARQTFNRYVECRWPIIVFALDPVADQQNIADSFSQRREMQLAMSLAFVSGQVSAKNMMQFARRLEMEMETVALNNTVVGFSHGNETFGWRFYPRFQTPDTESNFTVLFRDQLIGGPNRKALLRQRKIEPGQRECTAVVIMPSFVPYATLETSSHWFNLANPKHRDATCVEAVKLSARVKAIDQCADRVIDANCYRDGELDRLKAKAKQLEARLPLQSTKLQIPYENTLGGFAMFNTGITDLAPELYGWYGAPGIDTGDTTTLFLIGNHFSVHQTRVIVGGIHITDTEMLSRQVMRVTIPKGALNLDRATGFFPAGTEAQLEPAVVTPKKDAAPKKEEPKKEDPKKLVLASFANDAKATPCDTTKSKARELFVDVHIATPYGVTSHLLIPASKVDSAGTRPAAADAPDAFTCPQEDASKRKADLDRAAATRTAADQINKAAFDIATKAKAVADKEAADRIDAAAKAAAARAIAERDAFNKAVEAAAAKKAADEKKAADDAKKKSGSQPPPEESRLQPMFDAQPVTTPSVSAPSRTPAWNTLARRMARLP
jgi:hypothetical protein